MSNAAFAETYQRHFPRIRARCRRMLNASQAEDVAQETFLRLWHRGPSVVETDPRSIAAWLHQTSTRLALDARARGCRPVGDVDELPGASGSAEARLDARAGLAALATSSPREDLAAVLLVRSDGLTQPEAATALGISERTLRRRLERFDRRLLARVATALVLVLLAVASSRSCAAQTNADAVVSPR